MSINDDLFSHHDLSGNTPLNSNDPLHTILIIESDNIQRDLIKLALKNLPAVVNSVPDAETAFAYIKNHLPDEFLSAGFCFCELPAHLTASCI